jgi:nitrogen fixation-related uncharacterized protein
MTCSPELTLARRGEGGTPRTQTKAAPAPEPLVVPVSVVVIVATALLTLIAAGVLGWAMRRGFFGNLDKQALAVFDDDDLRMARPWESPAERSEREHRYGPAIFPSGGEWGGSSGGRKREDASARRGR